MLAPCALHVLKLDTCARHTSSVACQCNLTDKIGTVQNGTGLPLRLPANPPGGVHMNGEVYQLCHPCAEQLIRVLEVLPRSLLLALYKSSIKVTLISITFVVTNIVSWRVSGQLTAPSPYSVSYNSCYAAASAAAAVLSWLSSCATQWPPSARLIVSRHRARALVRKPSHTATRATFVAHFFAVTLLRR